MKIEIVEFYPKQVNDSKKMINGTLHIYLIDEGIDLRGIWVHKKQKYWFFALPHLEGIDPETKEKTRYPFFNYTDLQKQKDFIKTLRDLGIDYIQNNFLKKSDQKKERVSKPALP